MIEMSAEIEKLCVRMIYLQREMVGILKRTQKIRDEVVDVTNVMNRLFAVKEGEPKKGG